MNSESTKHKLKVMRTIMRNKDLSSILKDSLGSPIGSTKRAKAKAIISIMKKVGTGSYDGMGGVASGTAGFEMVQNSTPAKKTFIFPATPKMRTFDGKGGPLNVSGGIPSGVTSYSNLSIPQISIGDLSRLTASAGNAAAATQPLFGGVKVPNLQTPQAPAPAPSVPSSSSSSIPSINNIQDPSKLTYGGGVTGVSPKTPADFSNLNLSQFGSDAEKTAYVQSLLQGKGISVAAQPVAPVQTEPVKPTTPVTPQVAGTPATPVVTQPPGGSTLTPKPKQSSAQQAVSQNIGPSSFAYQTLSTPGAAEKELGLPAGSVTVGPNLTQQVIDINTALRKEYQVDDLQNQLINRSSQGKSLGKDMATYIKGRDEYLGYIDSLIDSANSQMKGMDMTTPGLADTMNTYTNYLYTLRGRQNQRYMDYVNQERDNFNKESESLQNRYNSVYQQYQTAVQQKTAITQEQYERVYNGLTDLYTRLENAPEKQLEHDIKEAQLMKIYADATKAAGSGLKDAAYWNLYSDVSNRYVDNSGNNKGGFKPGVNVSGLLTDLISSGVDPRIPIEIGSGGMAAEIQNKLDVRAIGDAMKTARGYVDELSNLAREVPQLGTVISSMGESLSNFASKTAIQQYVTNNYDEVKNVITGLVKDLSKKKVPPKDEWLKENSSVLDYTFLNDLYDYAIEQLKGDPNLNPSLIFSGTNLSAASPTDVAQRISAGIGGLWQSQINNVVLNQ